MQEVKKIGILSLAKIFTLSGILLGLITGIFGVILVSVNPTAAETIGLPFVSYGAWAILLIPLTYGIMYFIVGILTAVVYNLFARLVGGVKIELVVKK